MVVIGILLAWAISMTATTVIYYNEFQKYYERYTSISYEFIYVDFGINYGNGTIVWYNNTKFQNGTTVYLALLFVAEEVNSTATPFGVYVKGINGVNENINDSWMFAINRNDSNVKAWYKVNNWFYPGVGADSLTLKNGDKVIWVYFNWRVYYPPPDPTTTDYIR